MSAPTVEVGHTSGWLLREEKAVKYVLAMAEALAWDHRDVEPFVNVREAIDAALFRLSCSPCGECGGDGLTDTEGWTWPCLTCCLADGRSRWSELRVEPGFVPVRCEACRDGGVVVASIEGRSLEALCPAGCFRGWRVAP